jgi:hypothetical protein
MRIRSLVMAVLLGLGTGLVHAKQNLPEGKITKNTVGAPLQSMLAEPEAPSRDGVFTTTPLKSGTDVRVGETSNRYTYMGVTLVQVYPEGQSTPLWTFAQDVSKKHR